MSSWAYWNGMPIRIFEKLDEVSDSGQLIVGTNVDSVLPCGVYEINSGEQDHINPIPFRWTTPYFDGKAPHLIKRFRELCVDVDDYAGGLTIDWVVDAGRASGSFVAKAPTDMPWGDDVDNILKVWNDEAGSAENGLFWTETRPCSFVFLFPPSARGRRIQLTFRSDYTDPILEKVVVGYDWLRQNYPRKVDNA